MRPGSTGRGGGSDSPTRLMTQTAEQILKSIDWPTQYVVLDFETYFEKGVYSLSGLSAWEYITDKRFELTGLAACQPGRDPAFFEPSIPMRKFVSQISRAL